MNLTTLAEMVHYLVKEADTYESEVFKQEFSAYCKTSVNAAGKTITNDSVTGYRKTLESMNAEELTILTVNNTSEIMKIFLDLKLIELEENEEC